MTKNRVLPFFLKKTDAGWRVDTDDPSWGNLIAAKRGQSPAVNAAKREGTRLARSVKGNQAGGKPEKEEEAADGESNVRKALDAKVIYNARREKLRMEQDEIKTGKMKGHFVERTEGEYWLSFMQRGIVDSFSVVDRCFEEVKRLVLLGNGIEGKQYLKNELKRVFNLAARNMKEAIEGQDD
jgi:hypothetical protein